MLLKASVKIGGQRQLSRLQRHKKRAALLDRPFNHVRVGKLVAALCDEGGAIADGCCVGANKACGADANMRCCGHIAIVYLVGISLNFDA